MEASTTSRWGRPQSRRRGGGQAGPLGGPGEPPGGGQASAALGLWKEPLGLEDITRLSAGGRRSEFRRVSRRRTRRARGRPRHKARFVLRAPPGAGTNGLAAAEVIRQAAPGVRPGEGAAREGRADGRRGGRVCGRALNGSGGGLGLSLPIRPTGKIMSALPTCRD